MTPPFMRHTAGVTVCGIALLAGGSASAVPTLAETNLRCTTNYTTVLAPGLTLQQAPQTWHDLPREVTCTGLANGHAPTGPGMYTGSGPFTGSCLSGAGGGPMTVTIPTAAGPQKVTRDGSFSYPAVPRHGGLIGAAVAGDHLYGNFDLTPDEGDCVTRPLTQAHGIFEFTMF